ncbi:MBL fold metallo-hydrolase [Psychroflexus sediminis]|uniref:Beta-lactamase superfamily domain-containing protein n=1 Tax=Psychroflexus sediminis TaxID=470826 RepID=A0A1G7XII2_9FLAO|nr:MBL fold metallo-hydrolase [Psychroflexus sediminis]SDG83926.1 Beta-lactamase superfamily domain-containing protein [Psychroflexus sediminis]
MTYHHLRNATAVIQTKNDFILVDPMLGEVGTIEAFTKERFPPVRNPLVKLPENTEFLLQKVTHVLLTHQHADHLDEPGISFLIENNLPVTCSVMDAKDLKEKGLNVVLELEYNKPRAFLGGTIEGIPARHGYGKVAELMGNVTGFYIKMPNEPGLYLASDTILTDEVARVLVDYQPDISVIPCGSAQLDAYEPILMTVDDILRFTNLNLGTTICNHLEALNHCPTRREDLKLRFKEQKLSQKVWIPEDGDSKTINLH